MGFGRQVNCVLRDVTINAQKDVCWEDRSKRSRVLPHVTVPPGTGTDSPPAKPDSAFPLIAERGQQSPCVKFPTCPPPPRPFGIRVLEGSCRAHTSEERAWNGRTTPYPRKSCGFLGLYRKSCARTQELVWGVRDLMSLLRPILSFGGEPPGLSRFFRGLLASHHRF